MTAQIQLRLTGRQLSDLDMLSFEAKMSASDYLEMVIDQHMLQNAKRHCPECDEDFRGTVCPCKAPDVL